MILLKHGQDGVHRADFVHDSESALHSVHIEAGIVGEGDTEVVASLEGVTDSVETIEVVMGSLYSFHSLHCESSWHFVHSERLNTRHLRRRRE